MKKSLLLYAVLLINTVVLLAQPQPGGRQRMTVEERAKMATEWMKKELKLTEDQVAPVDSINLLFAKTQQILFQSAEGDREKIREAMTALEKEKGNALDKVLTEEQMKAYREKTQEMLNRMKERGNRREEN